MEINYFVYNTFRDSEMVICNIPNKIHVSSHMHTHTLSTKCNKPLPVSSTDRHIYLLDTAVKIIANRIEEVNDGDRGLSDCQYDFWEARSTSIITGCRRHHENAHRRQTLQKTFQEVLYNCDPEPEERVQLNAL